MAQTPEEKRAYNRARYRREKEKILAQQKERYAEKREEIISQNQAYYRANKDKIVERAKQHYADNREVKKAQVAARLLAAKVKAVMLLGGKCQICGYDEHPAALQFHHRDPSAKVFSITTNHLASPKKVPWDMVLEEIAKCDLLCSNCHAVHHSVWQLEGVWPVPG